LSFDKHKIYVSFQHKVFRVSLTKLFSEYMIVIYFSLYVQYVLHHFNN